MLLFLAFLPSVLFAYMSNCTCATSAWSSSGWVTTEWHYSTNTTTCFPATGTVYNFGFSYTYIDGTYIGITYYDGTNYNINNYMNCGTV